jgi:hypothetical protein
MINNEVLKHKDRARKEGVIGPEPGQGRAPRRRRASRGLRQGRGGQGQGRGGQVMTSRADIIMAEFDRMDEARGALRVAVLAAQEELAANKQALASARELQVSFTTTLLEHAPTCWDAISPHSPEVRACRYLRHLEGAATARGHELGMTLHRLDCAGDCPARETTEGTGS